MKTKNEKLKTKNNSAIQRRGFVLMLSVIMLSVILATSLGVFNLVYQGMKLSGTTRESQLAYYAADAGVECALFADFRGANSFGTTTAPSVATECANVSKLQKLSDSYVNGATFTVDYGNGSCVNVTVDKTIPPTGSTKLSAVGKNNCSGQATDQVNRSLEVTY
jgi:Tfp pilus assembly protein PilX